MASPSEVRIILLLILFRNAPMHLNLDRFLNCYSWCNFKIVFYFIYHILFFLEKTSKRIDVFPERTSPWCFCWFWISWTKSSTVSIVTITFLTSSTMWITWNYNNETKLSSYFGIRIVDTVCSVTKGKQTKKLSPSNRILLINWKYSDSYIHMLFYLFFDTQILPSYNKHVTGNYFYLNEALKFEIVEKFILISFFQRQGWHV